jgi:nitrogen regulatory protein P-II 1
MKMIVAIIQPDKLDEVRQSLLDAEITRITVSRVSGHGKYEGETFYRGQIVIPPMTEHIRLEIACNDAFVDITCNAIMKSARHGEGALGDGKIFILPLEECINLRTGERGGGAI